MPPFGLLSSPNRRSFQLQACKDTDSSAICAVATATCDLGVMYPGAGPYDVYDVRAVSPSTYPPDISQYMKKLLKEGKVGVSTVWTEVNYIVLVRPGSLYTSIHGY